MLQKLKDEVELVAGVIASAGIGTVVQPTSLVGWIVLLLPIVAAVVSRQHGKGGCVADLSGLNQAVADLQSAASAVASEVSTLKQDATPQSAVDPITSAVQSVTASLQQLAQPQA